ncbi:unnamed protein product [Cyclocybe aegerita]|uniref:Threonine aspartase n=1 Tax=Cyclocybe aegerita TaxID=1973307 RepID=A0A8S0WY26_CYCAE|nr:unnamed protein product [Cyclocybe aegerita]
MKQALKRACTDALAISSANTENSSLYTVETAIKVLEDDGNLNAGYGSNLTLDGTVECDSAVIHSPSNIKHGVEAFFGSVGAISGIKNPISAARAVLEHSKVKDTLGRVPPLTLVSSGAHTFATARGVESVDPSTLITPSARSQWEKWKARLDSTDEPSGSLLRDEEEEGLTDVQDTVGAVAFHTDDGFAGGVSSGGVLLKYPGRVGERLSAQGVGLPSLEIRTVLEWKECLAVSPVGQPPLMLIELREAECSRIGEALRPSTSDEDEKDPHDILNRLLVEFWEMARRRGEESPSVGAIVLTAEVDGDGGTSVRLWCAFTTASMAIGYASTGNPKARAVIFRHPNPHRERGEDRPQIFITSLSL